MNALTEIRAGDKDDAFHALAVEAIEQSDGSVEAATIVLTQRALGDPQFMSRHLEAIVHRWAHSIVRDNLYSTRRRIVAAVTAAPVDGSKLRAAVDGNYKRLMDMPLWGGKRIGDATADEIYTSADEHDKQARGHALKAAWQAAVAAALEKCGDPTARVRDHLPEATLQKLWEEASGD